MSVLINGMEMPQNGRVTLQIDSNGGVYVVNKFSVISEKYEKSMTATKIPPHGDLVDRGELMDIYADRLTAVAERYSPDSSECGILSGAMKLLAIQPTVIEAED